jgi:hypothetical protein
MVYDLLEVPALAVAAGDNPAADSNAVAEFGEL